MPTPREQAGLMAEASRLLQEGLQLLEERTREVDAYVQDAREQARQVTYDAEQQARGITAAAERRRAELEDQLVALQAEVAQLQIELAEIEERRQAQAAEVSRQAEVPVEVVSNGSGPDAAAESAAEESMEEEAEPREDVSGDTEPRWGRPSSLTAAQRPMVSRASSRRRWLPRWLPFVLLVLGGAAVVTANLYIQR